MTKDNLTTHPARLTVPISRSRRFARWVRLQLIRMVRENSTPAKTGLGFALGAFIGVFPSFLIGTPIAFFVAGRLGLNRAAAIGGTTLMNPLTAPVLYSISTKSVYDTGLDQLAELLAGKLEPRWRSFAELMEWYVK